MTIFYQCGLETFGIHLSPEGGRVIADEILKFFAKKYR